MINGCRTTKIFCWPDCPPGRRTKPQNRVEFASLETAREAGYRACKVCRPNVGLLGPYRSNKTSRKPQA